MIRNELFSDVIIDLTGIVGYIILYLEEVTETKNSNNWTFHIILIFIVNIYACICIENGNHT